MPADEGGRVDFGEVDRDDPRGAFVPGGEQGRGAVAGAQIEDAGAGRQIGEKGPPAVRNFPGIIGPARTVEAGRDAVILPVLAPDSPVRQLSPLAPNGGSVTGLL